MKNLLVPSGFERVPGRCGGRITLQGRRLEPGMLFRLHEQGETVDSLANAYDLPLEWIVAAIELCRSPDVVAEWDHRNDPPIGGVAQAGSSQRQSGSMAAGDPRISR